MTEIAQIVSLWKRARDRGEAVYLATVVHVSGSSYRKPGARMLVTSGGEYAGSVSGGCLEAEVSRRIAWLTRSGPTVEQYRSSFDDDQEEVPYGLGCGGTIWILMESGSGAAAVLDALQRSIEERSASVALLTLHGPCCGTLVLPAAESAREVETSDRDCLPADHRPMVRRALSEKKLIAVEGEAEIPAVVYLPILPMPRLTVFGAGDDAKPLVAFAAELGWEVTVADGRSHLLRRDRFPGASGTALLQYSAPEEASAGRHPVLTEQLSVQPDGFAVLLTHSLDQDRALLRALLPMPLCYLGILGPLHRTTRLLQEIAPDLGLTPDECLGRLHAPVGLNFGSGDASVIALAIVAEMQTVLGGTAGRVERHRGSLLEAAG